MRVGFFTKIRFAGATLRVPWCFILHEHGRAYISIHFCFSRSVVANTGTCRH
jgi:hypothetical protein